MREADLNVQANALDARAKDIMSGNVKFFMQMQSRKYESETQTV